MGAVAVIANGQWLAGPGDGGGVDTLHELLFDAVMTGATGCGNILRIHTRFRIGGGHCHAEIAKTYFDTYHGKVSRLGYTKTAKCYDCHGAHDILKVTDPHSHLSRANVVATCRKCHADATRRFAGYLTHATHHDPKKYPFLFWTFWGMTTLLVGTFTISGVHTLLWLPRALQMRRQLRQEEAREKAAESSQSDTQPKDSNDGRH